MKRARLCRLVEDVLIGQIFFEGEAPFELVTEREPIVIADEGFVIVNLAVFCGRLSERNCQRANQDDDGACGCASPSARAWRWL
jgi:hypothetical protein